MVPIFICDGVRTPIDRYGGALSGVRADDLAALPIRTLLERNPGMQADGVQEVVLGCTNQAGEDNRNIARMSLLLAGLPVTVPGMTVNRLCASGLEAVAAIARAIGSGDIELGIAGGIESMSRAPYVMGKSDVPFSRHAKIEDSTMGWRFVNPAMAALYGVDPMPRTAENIATQYGISRKDQDAFAYRSQERTKAAQVRGFHRREIVPVPVSAAGKTGGTRLIDTDENPRPATTPADLERLAALFGSGATVTAGSSSGINDGAAALIQPSHTIKNGRRYRYYETHSDDRDEDRHAGKGATGWRCRHSRSKPGSGRSLSRHSRIGRRSRQRRSRRAGMARRSTDCLAGRPKPTSAIGSPVSSA